MYEAAAQGRCRFASSPATAASMAFYYPRMDELNDGARMLFRSRHIYILLAGLVNVGVGAYFSYRTKLWRRVLQWTGSSLIIIAPLLLIGAFFYEPTKTGLPRPLTLPGIVSLFVGALCHLFSGVWAEPRRSRQISGTSVIAIDTSIGADFRRRSVEPTARRKSLAVFYSLLWADSAAA